MTLFDAFRYNGKRALVVGGATGMGASVAELVQDAGAEVVVMDYAEVTLPGVKAIHVNLADKASIDAAVDECGGPVHALFSCAGVADGTPGIERINFIGHRHLIDRLLAGDMLPRGSAIGMISSAAGFGWQANLEVLQEYLDMTDFDGAVRWAEEHGKADYMWSKQAINTYVAREAVSMLKRGIRINAICPGPTDTPLAQANADLWLTFGADYREELGVDASSPLDQAYPLVFLSSDAAHVISGITLVTDIGYFAAGMGWEANLAQLNELLDTPDFDSAVAWVEANGKADYMSMKQAVCAYVAREALPLLKRGIRINAICPGPTDTPLAQDNKETWLGFAADYREVAGTEPSTPMEQAYPLIFLCSDAAKAITGITVVSDAGYFSAGLSGSFPAATGIAQFLTGKM